MRTDISYGMYIDARMHAALLSVTMRTHTTIYYEFINLFVFSGTI